MRRLIWLAVGLLLCASLVWAQEPVVSWDVATFAAGTDPANGGQPMAGTLRNYPVTAVTCGLAKVGATTENPTEVRLDDPADTTKQCAIFAYVQVFDALPLGNGYRAAVKARGATSEAAWVLSGPFARVGSGPVLPATGVLVRKGLS